MLFNNVKMRIKTSGSNYAAKSTDFRCICQDMLFNNVEVKVRKERNGSNYAAKLSFDIFAKTCFSIINEILSLRQHSYPDNHMDI